MKNLKYLPPPYDSFFKEIVNSKLEPRKTELMNLKSKILSNYNSYYSLYIDKKIEKLKPDIFSRSEHDSLIHCYEGKSIPRNHLLSLIRKNQSLVGQDKCQYCGISLPETFDHYAPKVKFPAYSVYALNILPCCWMCNQKKSDGWTINGKRKYINLYLDLFLNKKFLDCGINYSKNDEIPSISFSISFSNEFSRNEKELIVSHFEGLNLIKRYNEQAPFEVSRMSQILNSLVDPKIQENCSERLKDYALATSSERGANNWQSVLYSSLSNSREFIDGVCRQVPNKIS